MKCLFVNILHDIREIVILKLLKETSFYFTHIYVRNITFPYSDIIHLECNRPNDAPGIYTIDYVNANIKTYSMNLTVKTRVCSSETGEQMEDEDESWQNTHVDYKTVVLCNNYNYDWLKADIEARLRCFFRNSKFGTLKKSIAVLDLDDTLIDEKYDLIIDNLDQYLMQLKKVYDYIVLWSYGCQQHVNVATSTTLRPYLKFFDCVIARGMSKTTHKKGIGKLLAHLNAKLGVIELGHTLLVDDQKCNYNWDYDYFLHAPSHSKHHSSRMWTLLFEMMQTIVKNDLIL